MITIKWTRWLQILHLQLDYTLSFRIIYFNTSGINRMKMLARHQFYWPAGLDADVENAVKQCTDSQLTAKSPINVHLIFFCCSSSLPFSLFK
jgi:hypothetical protein